MKMPISLLEAAHFGIMSNISIYAAKRYCNVLQAQCCSCVDNMRFKGATSNGGKLPFCRNPVVYTLHEGRMHDCQQYESYSAIVPILFSFILKCRDGKM